MDEKPFYEKLKKDIERDAFEWYFMEIVAALIYMGAVIFAFGELDLSFAGIMVGSGFLLFSVAIALFSYAATMMYLFSPFDIVKFVVVVVGMGGIINYIISVNFMFAINFLIASTGTIFLQAQSIRHIQIIKEGG